MKYKFVVHDHYARRHHHDLRLEWKGVLKSWAVPKGVPRKPGEKVLAIQVEDHSLKYGSFRGMIPEGQYGAGKVEILDKGKCEYKVFSNKKVEFLLGGKKLKGWYVLIKFKKGGKNWLLLKMKKR